MTGLLTTHEKVTAPLDWNYFHKTIKGIILQFFEQMNKETGIIICNVI